MSDRYHIEVDLNTVPDTEVCDCRTLMAMEDSMKEECIEYAYNFCVTHQLRETDEELAEIIILANQMAE